MLRFPKTDLVYILLGLVIVVIGIPALSSIYNSIQEHARRGYCLCADQVRVPVPHQLTTVRIKVLENSTISYVRLDSIELSVVYPLDSIWVNLATHRMDDTCNTTMRCVVFMPVKHP